MKLYIPLKSTHNLYILFTQHLIITSPKAVYVHNIHKYTELPFVCI